jgi:hypothetical protein
MYEPFAATILNKLTAEVATSALPDAPIRTEAPPRRAVPPGLRHRLTTLLVGLAGRLDPISTAPAAPGA